MDDDALMFRSRLWLLALQDLFKSATMMTVVAYGS